ncbi:hypothetical protein BC629DRAFT_1531775 [Irpex lacteus]|nr:hypothetical protein BC629DRAFT_1531775 [Irpex lacteus]
MDPTIRAQSTGLPAQLHTKKGAKAMITKNLDCGFVAQYAPLTKHRCDRPGPPLSVTVLLMMPDYDGPCVRRTRLSRLPRGAPAVSIAPWTAPAGKGPRGYIRTMGVTQTSGEVMSDPACKLRCYPDGQSVNITYMGADYKSAGEDSNSDKTIRTLGSVSCQY